LDYLQPHRGGKWRVRVVVPPDLVEKIGRRVLTRTTGTDDFDRAMKIATPIVREFRRIIDRAAGKPLGRVNHKYVRETSDEWFTPKWIFDSMPGVVFDLDPAAPPGGVPWIPARCHYSKVDDGLSQPWYGLCWLNAP
jgi:hypothetical protein